jgi:peptidoglycan/xylan/chitin deacetylase (PgdA/CDA1 family)
MNVVLVYHRIADDGWAFSVSPHHFAEHLEVLQTHAHVVSLSRLLQERSVTSAVPRVAITFDDGYRDNVTNAWPLLSRRGMPVAFFIVSGHVGSAREFWWDELEWLLFHGDSRNTFIEVQIGNQCRVFDLGMREERSDLDRTRNVRGPRSHDDNEAPRDKAYRELHELLLVSNAEEQMQILESIAASLHVRMQVRAEKLPVSHEQFQWLADQELAEIGSHTVQHLMLPALPVAVQEREIRKSKRDLEEMSGRTVSSFTYPYGAYSNETLEIVEQAGFHRACTVEFRPLGQETRFRIPRVTPRDRDGEFFAKQFQRVLTHPW